MSGYKTEVSMFNMCMIYNEATQEVVIQEKVSSDWKGLTFPGGKIEAGESFISATIREVYEETGLVVKGLKPCGTINWCNSETHERWLVFLYKTISFSGELLQETEEGKVYWSSIDKIDPRRLAPNMDTYLKLFLSDEINEAFATWDSHSQSEFTLL